MIFTPMIVPMMFLEHLFLFMGQDAHIAYIAGLYCKIVAPGMLFYFIGTSYVNYALCHGVTHYMLITLICASSFHWTLSTILCKYYDFKMYGIAITSSLHFVVRWLVPNILIRCNSFFDESIIPLSDKDSW